MDATQRVKMLLGHLQVENAGLAAQNEALSKRVQELELRLAPLIEKEEGAGKPALKVVEEKSK